MLGKLGRINIKDVANLGVAETLLPSSNSNQGVQMDPGKGRLKRRLQVQRQGKAEADSKTPSLSRSDEIQDTPSLFHLPHSLE